MNLDPAKRLGRVGSPMIKNSTSKKYVVCHLCIYLWYGYGIAWFGMRYVSMCMVMVCMLIVNGNGKGYSKGLVLYW